MTIQTTTPMISSPVQTGRPQTAARKSEWKPPEQNDVVHLKGLPPEWAEQPRLAAAPPEGPTLTPGWTSAPPSGNVFATLTMFEKMPVPDSERNLSGKELQALNIDHAFVDRMNVRFMDGGAPLLAYAESEIGDRSLRLATAGYSSPPQGYGPAEARFLEGMARLSQGDMATINSPSLPGKDPMATIDGMTTVISQKYNLPGVYITADQYLEYSKDVPGYVDRQQFEQAPKFSMPDAPAYSRFTALLSDGLAITGGRAQAISDFRNQIDAGHNVVVFVNDAVQAPLWEKRDNGGRIGNASAFLAGYLDPTRGDLRAQVPMGEAAVQEFAAWLGDRTTTDLVKSRFNPNGQVLFLNANDPDASAKAWEHLKR